MKTVELHCAFVWTCEECGRDNFARSVAIEDDAVRAMVDEEQLEQVEGIEGGWCTKPERVTCGHCGEEFRTAGDGEGED